MAYLAENYRSSCVLRLIFIISKPIPVHTNSRMRTMSATKIPADAVIPSPPADMRNPPSRPPNCKGMKNSRLANKLVNASMRIHCR